MPSFTVREKEGNLQKAIRGVYVIPTKPRSKRKWKKMKSMIILKRTEKNCKVKLLNPEALRQKILSLKYSRDYSFLFSEPVVRVSPVPPIPFLNNVSATTQGSKTKWFKTSASEITTGNKGTVKSSAVTIRGEEGYSYSKNKQRRHHCYQDYGEKRRRSSMEATKEDMKALRWIKEIEMRESWTKSCNPKWEPMRSRSTK